MLSIIISAILTLIFIFYFIKINVVKEFWNGDRTLAESYWLWHLFGPMIVAVIIGIFYGLLSQIFEPIFSNTIAKSILTNTYIYTYVFYFFFVLLGVWRSADKYIEKKKKSLEYPTWGKPTKFIVFLCGAYIPLILLAIVIFVKSKIIKK